MEEKANNDNNLIAELMQTFGFPAIAREIKAAEGDLFREYKDMCVRMAASGKNLDAIERLTMAGFIY